MKSLTIPKERYLTDEKGKKIAVIIDLEDYHKILEDLEELESIRAFDTAKSSGEEIIPFDKVIDEIERKRK